MEPDLFVRHLEPTISIEELQRLFEEAGEVSHINLSGTTQVGQSRGFAFITMGTSSQANKAISMFNTYTLNGFPLNGSLTKPRKQRGLKSAS